MKNLLLTIATFLTLNASSQNMTPVTRADVNEINLRLDGLEKFGRQHRTGNHMIITGTLFTGLGILMLNTTTAPSNPNTSEGYIGGDGSVKVEPKKDNFAIGTLLVGSLLTTTGVIINIDSFRHLRKNTDR